MAKLKKGSKAAKDFMAKIRAAKGKTKPKKVGATKILVAKKQSGGENRKYDILVQALPPGKRKTGKTHYANGKKITHSTIYTETRKNRSDKGKLLGIPIVSVPKNYAINEYYKKVIAIRNFENLILKIKNAIPTMKMNESKVALKKELAYIKKMLTEYKTHARELKKLIK